MRYLMVCISIALFGCKKTTGPDVITLNSSEYSIVFDAAVEAARADGMKPVVLDRRSGVIATEPAVAGSFLEPWKPAPSTPRQGLDNTLSFQRRTARFEFTPIEVIPVQGSENDVLVGPDLLSPTGMDITKYRGALELRVWVYVERNYIQGIRRGTWTLQEESVTTVLPAEEPWEQVPGSFWTPVTRDVAREKQLLGSVEAAVQ